MAYIYSIDVMDMHDAKYTNNMVGTFGTFKIENITLFFYKPEDVERMIWALTDFRAALIQQALEQEAAKKNAVLVPVEEDVIQY